MLRANEMTKVKKFVNDLLVSVKDYETRAREMSDNLTNALKEFQTSGEGRVEEYAKADRDHKDIRAPIQEQS